jgi:hypothetical protein
VPAEPSLTYPGYLPGRPSIGNGTPPYAHAQDAAYQQAQASQPASGYPGFGGSADQFPAGSTAAYPAGVPQLPVAPGNSGFSVGYPAAPLNQSEADSYQAGQFHDAPYDQHGYPATSQETGSYAGSDPYAMDPYGYPGYGSDGF